MTNEPEYRCPFCGSHHVKVEANVYDGDFIKDLVDYGPRMVLKIESQAICTSCEARGPKIRGTDNQLESIERFCNPKTQTEKEQ